MPARLPHTRLLPSTISFTRLTPRLNTRYWNNLILPATNMTPPKTALLIIDMQSFFASMTTTALPNTLPLLNAFSSPSPPLPIIFTQHGHSNSELADKKTRNQLIRKWGVGGSIKLGSADAEIMSELREYLPKEECKVQGKGKYDGNGHDDAAFPVIVPKNTYDAFLPPDTLSPNHYPPTPRNRQLHHILSAAGIERVVVCGVMTDCCVDTTARGAFNRGFETWVVSDACGSASKRQHEAALKGHDFGFGEILKTKEVLGRMSEEGILR